MQQGAQVRNPTIAEIFIADAPATWSDLGFRVDRDGFAAGTVRLRLTEPRGGGLVGWSLRDVSSTDLDGLPTEHSRAVAAAHASHPNGVLAVDHIVAITSSLDRTAAALDDAGIRLRRVREVGSPQSLSRQGFFRLGEVILEVVQPARPASGDPADGAAAAQEADDASRPARFWGLVFIVADLDALAGLIGERLGEPRDAVQPGRRIATLRREAGAGCPVAFITPEPAARPPEPSRASGA